MSRVEEIESEIQQLPPEDLEKLAAWMDQHRPRVLRDHSAFLSSYASSDEGLYDDAAARGNLAG